MSSGISSAARYPTIAVTILIIVAASAVQVRAYEYYRIYPGGTTGATYVVGLPLDLTSPSITDADTLSDAFGGPTIVEWVANWVPGSSPGMCEWNPSPPICTPQGAASCPSGCFAVSPSEFEAYMVRIKGGQTANVTLSGHDGPTSLSWLANQSYLVSIPYSTPLQNAFDLINSINTHTSGSVTIVSDWVTATESFIGYDGLSGTAFPLVPGKGYLVSLNSGVTGYEFPWNPEITMPPGRYVVTGTATTTDFAWDLEDTASLATCNGTTSITIGDSAALIVTAFTADINACGTPFSTTQTLNEFTLLPITTELRVEGCEVTTTGCTFNPTITFVPNPVPVPALGTVATALLILGLGLAAAWILRMRMHT